jgi:hypothetical protein
MRINYQIGEFSEPGRTVPRVAKGGDSPNSRHGRSLGVSHSIRSQSPQISPRSVSAGASFPTPPAGLQHRGRARATPSPFCVGSHQVACRVKSDAKSAARGDPSGRRGPREHIAVECWPTVSSSPRRYPALGPVPSSVYGGRADSRDATMKASVSPPAATLDRVPPHPRPLGAYEQMTPNVSNWRRPFRPGLHVPKA